MNCREKISYEVSTLEQQRAELGRQLAEMILDHAVADMYDIMMKNESDEKVELRQKVWRAESEALRATSIEQWSLKI